MCQVLRLWLRAGIINDLDPLFVSIMEEKRELKSIHLNDDEFRTLIPMLLYPNPLQMYMPSLA